MLQGAYSMHSAAERVRSVIMSEINKHHKTLTHWVCPSSCKYITLSFVVSLKIISSNHDPCLNPSFSPEDHIYDRGLRVPHPSRFHKCALMATLEIKRKTCWWVANAIGKLWAVPLLTLGAKLPWELSPVEWRDLFDFTAERSTLPGRPLPVSLIHQLCRASLNKSLPAAPTH